MTVNRLLLLLNSLLLLLLLVQRTQSEGGHLGWMGALPWGSFGTELAGLASQTSVSAGAVICLWLLLSVGWLVSTPLLSMARQRRADSSPATDGESTRLGAREPTVGADPVHHAPDQPPTAAPPSASPSQEDASIQQVLARLQQNVPDLSPEARAEIARLRAALQTLSDPETKP
jgi:hypothetical protein